MINKNVIILSMESVWIFLSSGTDEHGRQIVDSGIDLYRVSKKLFQTKIEKCKLVSKTLGFEVFQFLSAYCYTYRTRLGKVQTPCIHRRQMQ